MNSQILIIVIIIICLINLGFILFTSLKKKEGYLSAGQGPKIKGDSSGFIHPVTGEFIKYSPNFYQPSILDPKIDINYPIN